MKKQKEPKVPKEKKTFLERYRARKPFKLAVREMFLPVITLILCIFLAENICEFFIGDALYLYSNDTYMYIESAIVKYTTSGEDGGVQTVKLQKIFDKISLSYDKKTNTNTLVCSIRNAFFNAQVTVHLSEDFVIPCKQISEANSDTALEDGSEVSSEVATSAPSDATSGTATATAVEDYCFERNFTSFQDYKKFYWLVFKGCMFGGGILIWALAIGAENGILWLCAKNASNKEPPQTGSTTPKEDSQQ